MAARTACTTEPVVRWRAASRAAVGTVLADGQRLGVQAAGAEEFGDVPLRWGQIGTGVDAVARDERWFRCRPWPGSRPRPRRAVRPAPSVVSASCVSSTTPAAPPATAAAAVCGPMPPAARTGTVNSGSASRRCSSTKVVSSPTRPPASCPLATSPAAPAATAAAASAGLTTSAHTRRLPPAAQLARPGAPVLFGEQNGVHRGGQFVRGERASGRYADSVTPSQPGHRGARPFAVPAEVEQAQRAGPFRGRDHRGVGLLERADHDDEVPA